MKSSSVTQEELMAFQKALSVQQKALSAFNEVVKLGKMARYPNRPAHTLTFKTYRDNNANSLTTAIIDYIRYLKGSASRVNTQGQYREGQTLERGLTYEIREQGKWTPSGSDNGTADILGTFRGQAIAIEVKFGKDKLSEAQERWRDEWIKPGSDGIYLVAKSFQQFFEAFNSLFNISL